MRKLILTLVVLLMVSSISFALEVGGSTTVGAIGNSGAQRIEIDQEVDIDIDALHFDVNGGFDYDLPGKAYAWNYELGAAYTFSIFKVGGSITGKKDLNLNEVKAYADIAIENAGADVDFLFSADKTKDPFQGAEFSLFYKPGPFEFRTGYLLTKVGDGGVNAPEELKKGGLYAKAKVSY